MPSNPERGQALPLALAGIFAAALFFSLALRSTERLLQRERVRARADATAFSAGVSYARGLNLLAASQKAVALGWVATVLDAGRTRARIQRVQAHFLKAGPWYSQAVALSVAHENGLMAVPVWNQEALLEDLQAADLLPSYNVAPYTVTDAAVAGMKKGIESALSLFRLRPHDQRELRRDLEARARQKGPAAVERAAGWLSEQGKNRGLEGLAEISHYEYTRKDGTRVRVEKQDAGEVWERDGRGGRRPRYKANARHKHRYVRAVPTLNADFQLSLDEGQPHMITLLALQGPADDAKERRPGRVLALAQVQVAGGSQSLVDPDGSAYGATLVPVRIFEDDGAEKTETLGQLRHVTQSLPLPPLADAWLRRGLDLGGALMDIQH